MFDSNTTLIGIDPTAGQRPMAFAALNHKLEVLQLGQGSLDEVLAYVAGHRQAVVAVSGPRMPNQGLLAQEAVRMELSPAPRPGRWTNFRLAEYQLRQHNIHIPRTPAQEEDCPAWMQTSFHLYRRLADLGYFPFPGRQEGEEPPHGHQVLEVYPHASYAALLGLLPFAKNSLEGRLQRQLVLYERKVRVPDPMVFFEEITRYRLMNGILPTEQLYTPGELDALVAAFTAWSATLCPQPALVYGSPDEGQIVLPVAKLKSHYSSKIFTHYAETRDKTDR